MSGLNEDGEIGSSVDHARMDTKIPVVVRMHVECKCGHVEDETYEFDMPFKKAQAMEANEPGKCPECGEPVQIHLKRWQQRQ